MGLEYQTGRFDNNSYGVEARMHWINQMAGQGWRIASETVEPGHVRGGQACCLATLCLPLGFAALQRVWRTARSLHRLWPQGGVGVQVLQSLWPATRRLKPRCSLSVSQMYMEHHRVPCIGPESLDSLTPDLGIKRQYQSAWQAP